MSNVWSKAASASISTVSGIILSANPNSIDEATRQHYAELYARSGAMHSAFNQFAAFAQEPIDNKAFAAKGKLTMPVLAFGADIVRNGHGRRFVLCRHRRHLDGHRQLGALADGRTASRHNRRHQRIPEQEVMMRPMTNGQRRWLGCQASDLFR
jgi:hypothetical protein